VPLGSEPRVSGEAAPETAPELALDGPPAALPTTPELLRLGRRADVSARERAVTGAEEAAPL
jgi:hypothetical protein